MQDIRRFDVPFVGSVTSNKTYERESKFSAAAAEAAIDMLHLNLPLSVEHQLIHFMRKRYEQCKCVVLSAKSSNSRAFFESFGINVGRQEVVLNSSGQILYTENYYVPPQPVG